MRAMLSKQLFPWLLIIHLLTQALSIAHPRALIPRVDGNIQADDQVCTTYKDCSQKGAGYKRLLRATLSQPQISDRNDRDLFNDHYFAAYDASFTADPDIQQSLTNRGMPITNIDSWEISGLDPKALTRDDSPAYYNLFDTNSGLIVAEGNWRAQDSQRALPWSEIMYQTWQRAAEKADTLFIAGQRTQAFVEGPVTAGAGHRPGGPISNLRSVVQHLVLNKGTQEVLKQAYEANGWRPGYDGLEGWRKWTEKETPQFFDALLGTDNVKGTVWLLRDHADEIGRKDIEAIWSRWHMGNPDLW
ncbi:MAG: hypothetical protein Q9208_003416 [Pyrenodesmia sp. 3 TL-2023]